MKFKADYPHSGDCRMDFVADLHHPLKNRVAAGKQPPDNPLPSLTHLLMILLILHRAQRGATARFAWPCLPLFPTNRAGAPAKFV
jgi:hypothetical protein